MAYDERFDRIDANIERLEAHLHASLARIEANIDRLTQYVLDFRDETARHFDMVDNRLDVVAANLSNIEARYPTIAKAILDFGKVSTQLTNDQARSKNSIAELTARMDRLEERVSKAIQPAA